MIQIDIEMPEKCGLCPLFHAEHPMYCQGVKADRKKKIVAPYEQPRPEWCPLHEDIADPDTISRQQAIDAVTLTEPIVIEFGGNSIVGQTTEDMISALKNLPPSPSRPSEPQIIHCKDCKYGSPDGKGCKSYAFLQSCRNERWRGMEQLKPCSSCDEKKGGAV